MFYSLGRLLAGRRLCFVSGSAVDNLFPKQNKEFSSEDMAINQLYPASPQDSSSLCTKEGKTSVPSPSCRVHVCYGAGNEAWLVAATQSSCLGSALILLDCYQYHWTTTTAPISTQVRSFPNDAHGAGADDFPRESQLLQCLHGARPLCRWLKPGFQPLVGAHVALFTDGLTVLPAGCDC